MAAEITLTKMFIETMMAEYIKYLAQFECEELLRCVSFHEQGMKDL